MHDPFKTASGVQNLGPWGPWQASDLKKKRNPWCTSRGCRVQISGPWDSWIPGVKNTADFSHSARCAPPCTYEARTLASSQWTSRGSNCWSWPFRLWPNSSDDYPTTPMLNRLSIGTRTGQVECWLMDFCCRQRMTQAWPKATRWSSKVIERSRFLVWTNPEKGRLDTSETTFRLVVVSLRGPGQSPGLPFACCVGSLRSVSRCWCRFRVCGAQLLVCRGCAGCGGMCRLRVSSAQ